MLKAVNNFFNFDPLAIILISLTTFIGICIASFSYRFMKGDTRFGPFFLQLSLLVGSVLVMVSADDILLFFTAWCSANFFLVQLMIHKSSWQAAKSSGLLTAKNYVIGATFLGLALFLLNISTGTSSIQNIGQSSIQSPLITLALVLLLISSMTQSSLWPFHRWLVSSLNSPTPVSAIMHAGLINGGFFLLARFAPLFFKMPGFLTLLFVFGIATALLGTLWKLMQSDIKRMLACSTMGQMGFMLAQCGLGLFPAALAHLITHGMFKAYLFLASGSASHEKRHDISYSLTPLKLLYSLMCGMLGSFWFALTSGKTWFSGDTTLVLMVIALITSTQFAIPILMLKSRFRVLTALIGTSCVNIFYGFSVQFISNATKTMEFSGCVEKFYRESLRKTP